MLELFKKRPTPADAATRLVILRYQIVHALATPPVEYLATMSETDRQAMADEFRDITARTCESAKASGVWKHLSAEERDFLSTPGPLLSPQRLVNALWRTEAAGCLMWSLELLADIPPYDTQSRPEILQQIASGGVREFIQSASLRNVAEIDKARDVAELWHWRSRTRQLEEQGYEIPMEAGSRTVADIVSVAAGHAFKAGDIGAPIAGDFAIFGKSYRDADAEEWSIAQSIAMERHFAFNWLCGRAHRNRWSETPTDT